MRPLAHEGALYTPRVPHLPGEHSSESIVHATPSMTQAHRRFLKPLGAGETTPAALTLESLGCNFPSAECYYSAMQVGEAEPHSHQIAPLLPQPRGSLPLPKQLHANLQCEMSIRLLISVEGSPLIHPKAVEVILSQSF